jgi:hypothetical protein
MNVYQVSVEESANRLGDFCRLSLRLARDAEARFSPRARMLQITFVLGEPAQSVAALLRRLADELERA